MAEQEQLIIEISAETVGLVRALANAQNGLQDFAKEGKTTAATMTSALSAINKEAKNTFDVNALTNYNRAIRELRDQLKDVRSIGVTKDTGLGQIPNQAKDARVALYGLNQVVRDLPFGFIAISNNIPVALDQFQKLISTSGGVGNAFRNLGSALIGAGGLSFAFSAVTSLITTAIQKYGSLGTAINDVFDLIDRNTLANIKQTDAIDKSTASLVTEISKINQLVDVLSDAEAPQADRINSYKQLAKEYPGIIQDLTQENALTAQGVDFIKFRTQETLKYIILKGKEAALVDLIKTNSIESQKAQTALIRQLTGEGRTFVDTIIDIGKAWATGTPPVIETAKEVGKLGKEIEKYSKTLQSTRSQIIATDPLISGLDKTLPKTKEQLAQEARLQQKAAEDLRQARIAAEIKIIESRIKLEESALKNLDNLTREYQDKKLNILKLETDIRKLQIEATITDTKQRNEALKNLDLEYANDARAIINGLADDRKKANDKQVSDAKNALAQQTKDLEDYINNTTEAYNRQDPGGVQRRINEFYKNLAAQNKAIDESLKQQSKAYNDFAKNLASNFANIAGDLAEAFMNGQNAAEVFRSSLKRLIADLVVTIAKAAILRTITSAIGGGGGFAASTGGLLGGGGGFNLFDFFGARAEAIAGNAPRPRGVNIGAGGMTLAGNVTFVQRGTDLVGVLNAGNARIKRVG